MEDEDDGGYNHVPLKPAFTVRAKITRLKPAPVLPPDLPGRLRKMADDVEAGIVTAMAVGYVCEDNYEFLWPSSLTESLTITTLMQASALDRFRR